MKKIVPVDAVLIPDAATRVFTGEIFDVYHWQQEMFDGTFETFERLRRTDSVYILAIKDGKLVISHEQQPDMPPFYDAPAGRHDHEDETQLQAAQREMVEETGMTFGSWKLINVIQPYSKIEWFEYVFLATDFISQGEQQLDAGEKITTDLLSWDEFKSLHAEGKIRSWFDFYNNISGIDDLLAVPEFKGKEIER